MNKNLYVLIMAGGEGARFYPLSTPELPKQFLSFWGDRTLIQQTYDRIAGLVPSSNIYVATNQRYVGLVKNQLPDIPIRNIIGEPQKKNTAPCIAYVSKIVSEIDKEALILVLPSDHLISKEREFKKVMDRGVYIATQRDVLVTLGIKPTWAADCYSYIKLGRLIEDDPDGKWNAYLVDRFMENISVADAQGLLEDGSYVWNSGIYIWKTALILKEIEKHLSNVSALLDKCKKRLTAKNFFRRVESISIDSGVLSRSQRAATIPCSLGWSGIGSWQSLYQLAKSNVITLKPYIESALLDQLGL